MTIDEFSQTYDDGFIAGCDHMQLTVDRCKDAIRVALTAIYLSRKHAAQGIHDPRFAKDQCIQIAELLGGVIKTLSEATDDESRERHDTAVFEQNYGGTEDD